MTGSIRAPRFQGFTLLEVLVALAILSLVMLVLGQTVGSAINAYGHLELKTRAWMVASDKMVEMQVYARWPSIGTQKEDLEQDGEHWQVTTQVTKGPFDGTRRVDVSVTLKQDAQQGGSLYTLTGLLGQPRQSPTSAKTTSQAPGTTGASGSTGSGNGVPVTEAEQP